MTLDPSQTLLLEQRRGMIDFTLLDALDVLRVVPRPVLFQALGIARLEHGELLEPERARDVI